MNVEIGTETEQFPEKEFCCRVQVGNLVVDGVNVIPEPVDHEGLQEGAQDPDDQAQNQCPAHKACTTCGYVCSFGLHCKQFSIYVFPKKTQASLTPKYLQNIFKQNYNILSRIVFYDVEKYRTRCSHSAVQHSERYIFKRNDKITVVTLQGRFVFLDQNYKKWVLELAISFSIIYIWDL